MPHRSHDAHPELETGTEDMTDDSNDTSAVRPVDVYLVRHAPTDTPPGHVPLADPPIREAAYRLDPLIAMLPKGADWLVSPFERTRSTAKMLAPELAPASRREEAMLREMDIGEWHGRPVAEVWSTIKDGPLHNWQFFGADTQPPGGETFARHCARVEAWMGDLLRAQDARAGESPGDVPSDSPPRPIIAITHAGVIRAAIGVALAAPPDRLVGVPVANFGVLKLTMMVPSKSTDRGGAWLFCGLTDPGVV